MAPSKNPAHLPSIQTALEDLVTSVVGLASPTLPPEVSRLSEQYQTISETVKIISKTTTSVKEAVTSTNDRLQKVESTMKERVAADVKEKAAATQAVATLWASIKQELSLVKTAIVEESQADRDKAQSDRILQLEVDLRMAQAEIATLKAELKEAKSEVAVVDSVLSSLADGSALSTSHVYDEKKRNPQDDDTKLSVVARNARRNVEIVLERCQTLVRIASGPAAALDVSLGTEESTWAQAELNVENLVNSLFVERQGRQSDLVLLRSTLNQLIVGIHPLAEPKEGEDDFDAENHAVGELQIADIFLDMSNVSDAMYNIRQEITRLNNCVCAHWHRIGARLPRSLNR